MSFDNHIRSALEKRLATVAGLPPIAYEGIQFRPNTGTPYVLPTVIPVSSRASSPGTARYILYLGIFLVVLAYPNGQGLGTAEAMANLVKEAFRSSIRVDFGEVILRFRYAERRATIHNNEWIRIPIEISYYVYDVRREFEVIVPTPIGEPSSIIPLLG